MNRDPFVEMIREIQSGARADAVRPRLLLALDQWPELTGDDEEWLQWALTTL